MSSQDNSPDVRRVANGMTEGAGRWTLSRAGIINVYQYDNEILHFAGGRLLLRGINGSGKSTAMNMLLPFLLDVAAQALERLHVATERAASAVQRARQDASTDHDALRCCLFDLASLSSGCALTARPPGLPSITSGPDSADGPAELDPNGHLSAERTNLPNHRRSADRSGVRRGFNPKYPLTAARRDS
jgi:hypothetical protein